MPLPEFERRTDPSGSESLHRIFERVLHTAVRKATELRITAKETIFTQVRLTKPAKAKIKE